MTGMICAAGAGHNKGGRRGWWMENGGWRLGLFCTGGRGKGVVLGVRTRFGGFVWRRRIVARMVATGCVLSRAAVLHCGQPVRRVLRLHKASYRDGGCCAGGAARAHQGGESGVFGGIARGFFYFSGGGGCARGVRGVEACRWWQFRHLHPAPHPLLSPGLCPGLLDAKSCFAGFSDRGWFFFSIARCSTRDTWPQIRRIGGMRRRLAAAPCVHPKMGGSSLRDWILRKFVRWLSHPPDPPCAFIFAAYSS